MQAEEIRALARDIGKDYVIERVEEKLLDNDTRGARIAILAYLDGWYSERAPDERAREFYDRLGFTAEERSQIRQNAALDRS